MVEMKKKTNKQTKKTGLFYRIGKFKVNSSYGGQISIWMQNVELRLYTLLEKCCCTLLWDNKIDMDRIFVLPVGWNWHEMYLWLLPDEIQPNLPWTFISMRQSVTAGRVGLTHATVNHILRRHAVIGTSVPGKSTGAPRKTMYTSSRTCFVQDGPTGSLHKCSGLVDTDEEFVWIEGWPENHQQSAIVPWLPCL